MPVEGRAKAYGAVGDRIVIDRGARRTIVSLPRHGVLSAAFLIGLIAVWGMAAGVYVVFHDTVVAELRRGASATAKGYEAQIGALRDELERSRTRRLVERTGTDERLAELSKRQEALERRQIRLSELSGAVQADAPASGGDAFSFSMKPVPLDQPSHALDSVDAPAARASEPDASGKVTSSLDTIEVQQARALEALASKTEERRLKLEQVYDAIRAPKPAAGAVKGRGGPFEPLPSRAMTFEARADEIEANRAAVASLTRGLDRIPLRTPSPGSSLTSGFGVRSDPFFGRPALHGGVDFEGDLGDAVRATAIGRVVSAGWSGGYGNMVELDHGGGLSTRYGHMSLIAVHPGQDVKPGDMLGRVGSTGRSTGPHLHYETRVDGEAVDPLKYLRAGRLLVTAPR